VVRATTPTFDARLAPASDAPIKEFRIPIKDATIEIAKGVSYQGWTFGGTVPGPVIRVRVGDRVRVVVTNESPMPHSIDFHAARIPANVAYRMILPKDSVSFEFVARDAGAFMVHCGTPRPVPVRDAQLRRCRTRSGRDHTGRRAEALRPHESLERPPALGNAPANLEGPWQCEF
jgi:hypothetical protein